MAIFLVSRVSIITYAEEIEWHRYEMPPDLGESLLDLLYRETPVRNVSDLR